MTRTGVPKLAVANDGIPAWHDQAACRGHMSLFFPGVGQSTQAAKAKAMCRTCPVLTECADYALRQPSDQDEYGIWGGMSPEQRATRRKRKGRAA